LDRWNFTINIWFNYAVSTVLYIVLNGRTTMNNELERMWKEAVMAQFEVLSQYLPADTEETIEEPQPG
jgi:hypothetical protein